MSIKSNIFKSGCVAILASSCILGAYAYSEKPAFTYSNSNNNLTINIDKTAAAHQAFGAFTFCCLSIAALSAGYGTRIGLQIREERKIKNFRNQLILSHLNYCLGQ